MSTPEPVIPEEEAEADSPPEKTSALPEPVGALSDRDNVLKGSQDNSSGSSESSFLAVAEEDRDRMRWTTESPGVFCGAADNGVPILSPVDVDVDKLPPGVFAPKEEADRVFGSNLEAFLAASASVGVAATIRIRGV